MVLLELVRSLVGPVPPGYEVLEYAGALILAALMLRASVSVFGLARSLMR